MRDLAGLLAADDDCFYDWRWTHEPDWHSVRDDQPPATRQQDPDQRAPAVRGERGVLARARLESPIT